MCGEEAAEARSEAPYNSSGCAVVVLVGAGVATMHVVALQPPRKILEEEFVVHAATYVQRGWAIDEVVGIDVANAAHGMHERSPFSETCGHPQAAENIVLGNATAVEATAVSDQPDVRKARKRQSLDRGIPPAVAQLVD